MKKLVVLFIGLFSVSVNAYDRVTKFDTDGDAKVSYEELVSQCPNTMKALFSLADKDNDGFLSNIEMRTAKDYLFKKCKK
jgi:Ca2+-binding EF-hand superfamily protein